MLLDARACAGEIRDSYSPSSHRTRYGGDPSWPVTATIVPIRGSPAMPPPSMTSLSPTSACSTRPLEEERLLVVTFRTSI